MGAFMLALAQGAEPPTSGRDNLESIRIAYAAVQSGGPEKPWRHSAIAGVIPLQTSP